MKITEDGLDKITRAFFLSSVISRMAARSVFGFLVLLCYFLLLLTAADEKEHYEECPYPESFFCGYLGEIRFPFTNTSKPECGLPIRGCDGDEHDKEVQLKNQSWYKIHSIHQDWKFGYNSFSIYYTELENIFSSRDGSAFNYNPGGTIIPPDIMSFYILTNITFSRCGRGFNANKTLKSMFKIRTCPDSNYDIYSSEDADSKLPDFPCSQHHPGQLPNSADPCTFITSYLEIEVNLIKSCQECYFAEGSRCVIDMKQNQCVNLNEYAAAGKEQDGGDSKKVMTIGFSIGLAVMTTIAFLAILLLYKRRRNSSGYQNKPRNVYSGSYSNANPESGTVYFGVPVFSYEELQEATNNFDQARELGEGGFGTVYYGMLRDGREVAVKRLYERNYRPVESFINEIQILTRLRHRNLVSLYGCTSRHSRELLLVYEYIPNGTVGSHLHGDKAKPGSLPWPVRMKIAIETASALTYLHASDIIHRDVKTSNILVDNNFCVKVADFGLSRLFPNDVTHVSTAPRGTPGYVDPDYRICYQLTSKSDVYSFGVVLVELISSLPAIDMTRGTGDIKLANLAIRKIQKCAFSELVDPSLGFQSDHKLKRMIISVAELAFQCLQGDKELRPSMGEVLEALQRIESRNDQPGNLEGIDVHGAGVSHSYAHPSLPNTLMKPQRLYQTF